MNFFRLLIILVLSGVIGHAQSPTPAVVSPVSEGALRTAAELEQLMAPIALYPDALIALILPAATVPADIVLAARHVRENGSDRSQIEHRAWDDSVKSLTHYPDVLKWMDENLAWTKQVGEAFALQSADVMQAVQSLREKARATGALTNTPQQQVIAEPQVIRIVPTQPDVIYVPYYQPEVVFVDRPTFYSYPVLTFWVGVAAGSWLAYDCDWRQRTIWIGNRHRPWTGHDWRRSSVVVSSHYTRTHDVRAWRPPPSYFRPSMTVHHHHRNRPAVVRPAPMSSSHSRAFAPRFANPPSNVYYTDGHGTNSQHRASSSAGNRPATAGHRPSTVQPPTTAVVPPVNWSTHTNSTYTARSTTSPRTTTSPQSHPSTRTITSPRITTSPRTSTSPRVTHSPAPSPSSPVTSPRSTTWTRRSDRSPTVSAPATTRAEPPSTTATVSPTTPAPSHHRSYGHGQRDRSSGSTYTYSRPTSSRSPSLSAPPTTSGSPPSTQWSGRSMPSGRTYSRSSTPQASGTPPAVTATPPAATAPASPAPTAESRSRGNRSEASRSGDDSSQSRGSSRRNYGRGDR